MWEQVNCRRQTEAAETSVMNFASWSRRVHLVRLWRWEHSVEKKRYIPRTKTAAPYSVSRGGKILSLHNIRAIWPKGIVYSERRSPALWTIYGAVHLWRVANCTNYSSRINKNKKKHNKWDLWKRSVSWNPKSGATVQKKNSKYLSIYISPMNEIKFAKGFRSRGRCCARFVSRQRWDGSCANVSCMAYEKRVIIIIFSF